MGNRKQGQQWVALLTFVAEAKGKDMFYEEGAVYDHEPPCKSTAGGRRLESGEATVVCPRCGQLFATTDETAEDNRNLHFNGDEDIPSICLHLGSLFIDHGNGLPDSFTKALELATAE